MGRAEAELTGLGADLKRRQERGDEHDPKGESILEPGVEPEAGSTMRAADRTEAVTIGLPRMADEVLLAVIRHAITRSAVLQGGYHSAMRKLNAKGPGSIQLKSSGPGGRKIRSKARKTSLENG